MAGLSAALTVLVLALALAGPGVALELDVRPRGAPPAARRPFVAAVLEVAPDPWDLDSSHPWRQNLATIDRQAEAAAAQGADLLVLPEYGITSSRPLESRQTLARFAAEVPSPDDLVEPCGNESQHEVVSNISCLAKKHSMYVVANYVERLTCSKNASDSCPEDGFYLFNVNLVYDRNGTLIQRYRKYNRFGIELRLLQAPEPHLAAFRTDFGVTFGLMTCFDILFEVPAVELTRRGVTHLAFPTHWGDELPSLTALQMHSAWARGLGVTLLSAGFHNPQTGSLGSGVFTASGALNYTYRYASQDGGLVTVRLPAGAAPAAGETTCLAGQPLEAALAAPTERPPPADGRPDPYYPLQHYDVSEFASAPLAGESLRLCHGDLCCSLNVRGSRRRRAAGDDGAATYRLLAFKGRRNFAPHFGTEICLVMLCANATQASCSFFPGGPAAELEPFALSGTFSGESHVFPSVVRAHMRLADDWQYDRQSRGLSVDDTSQLLAAQLYARNFADDRP